MASNVGASSAQMVSIPGGTFLLGSGYMTLAEYPPNAEDYPGATPETLVPGLLIFHRTPGPVDLRDWSQWWAYVPGAQWRHPLGPGSSIEGLGDHPVVHVAYEAECASAKPGLTYRPIT